jgi:asparagine synthase (glutamine-hydrolysing)
MCGIAGTISLIGERYSQPHEAGAGAVSPDMPIVKMIAQMQHRGPDDQGSVLFRTRDLEVVLGHTRLSIIDLTAAGHQPMGISDCRSPIAGWKEKRKGEGHRAEGERRRTFWIAYNGEIYNYKELKEELRIADCELQIEDQWKSESDTEVILKAYSLWGEDSLRKLRGMFALAIWDSHCEELILARDRFGIKPLYYYATDKLFVFASEIRTLLASGLVPRQLSIEGVASYLQSGAVSSPLTIIQGVRSLLPGNSLSVRRNAEKLQCAISDSGLPIADSGLPIADRKEAVALLRQTLEDSVRAHLVSDVPVAAFLSGGIDSSALVALMCQVAEEPPKTFTVTFSEKGFSEESFAKLIAQQFETQHHEIYLSETALLRMLPDALAAMDQPTIDGINTYVISQAVSEAGIKVALSGLGGDELFAGYPSFRRVQRLRGLASVPGSMRRAVARAGRAVASRSVQQRKAWDLLEAGATAENAYTISRQLFSGEEVSELMGREVPGSAGILPAGIGPQDAGRMPALPGSDSINAVSVYEMTGYMANTLLRDTDSMSMAHSLEVRVPFVDAEVVGLVLGMPGNWKVDGSRPKPLLLDALGDLLPEKIWRRRKMGFVLPFERWMHSVLRSEMEATFAGGKGLLEVGLGEFGSAIWKAFDRTPRRERWTRPWALYVLKCWCELNDVRL